MALQNKNVKILLTGGGTGGSVAPLLAAAEEIRGGKSGARSEFLWLGTKNGVERRMAEDAGIEFRAVMGGRWRRYWSWRNLVDPFFIFIGFIQSLFIVKKEGPNLVMSAGSFVSVPAVWAAWVLRVPVLIHQQDARPGLANKLMAPCARMITVTFEKSLSDYGDKAVWVGNFIRPEFKRYRMSARESRRLLGLRERLPVVLILGGGTGAAALNELTVSALPVLVKICQVVHITGPGKSGAVPQSNYHPFEFVHIDGMIKSYMAADLVVSRCGMGVLTELSYLGKPAIIIPMPDTHQEDNAAVFYGKRAAIVLDQNELTARKFASVIKKLLKDGELRHRLSRNIRGVIKPGANQKIAEIITEIIEVLN